MPVADASPVGGLAGKQQAEQVARDHLRDVIEAFGVAEGGGSGTN